MEVLDALPSAVLATLEGAALAAGAVLLAVLAHAVLATLARRAAGARDSEVGRALIRHGRRPARLLLVALALRTVTPLLGLPPDLEPWVARLLSATAIVASAWLVIGLTQVAELVVQARYDVGESDNLQARRVRTKARLLRRVVALAVSVVALAGVLMTFPPVRELGISLFASAGVAGLVLGVAAQPTLSNLVAGLQLALTEPIRLDDVVIVEGEWGRVEEITMTYVVVRIWDMRRLVVPLRHFIEHPFENWTRTTADILGAVMLHVDPRTPLDPMRDELRRLVESREEWDGEVVNLQVVDATEHTIRVRALMSASSSGEAWDLRCAVREGLVTWLQREHPDCLPRVRGEIGMERPDGPPVATVGRRG